MHNAQSETTLLHTWPYWCYFLTINTQLVNLIVIWDWGGARSDAGKGSFILGSKHLETAVCKISNSYLSWIVPSNTPILECIDHE